MTPSPQPVTPLTDEEVGRLLEYYGRGSTDRATLSDVRRLLATITALKEELAEAEMKLGDYAAGCDIQRGDTLYRQVEVVIGPGKTTHELRANRAESELARLKSSAPGLTEEERAYIELLRLPKDHPVYMESGTIERFIAIIDRLLGHTPAQEKGVSKELSSD
jgi:hypothetical protein